MKIAGHKFKMERKKRARAFEYRVTGAPIRVPNTGVKRGGQGGYRYVDAVGGTRS